MIFIIQSTLSCPLTNVRVGGGKMTPEEANDLPPASLTVLAPLPLPERALANQSTEFAQQFEAHSVHTWIKGLLNVGSSFARNAGAIVIAPLLLIRDR